MEHFQPSDRIGFLSLKVSSLLCQLWIPMPHARSADDTRKVFSVLKELSETLKVSDSFKVSDP